MLIVFKIKEIGEACPGLVLGVTDPSSFNFFFEAGTVFY
jgi:hypothetical protein